MLNKQQNYEEKLKNFNPESRIETTENHYSDKKFWDKVKNYGKQAGKQTMYYSLLLFYTAKSPTVPKSSKMIVCGCTQLSYLPSRSYSGFHPGSGSCR